MTKAPGSPAFAADDARAHDVRELLATHLAYAVQHTPPQDVHAMDPAALTADDISMFSIRRDGLLLAVGALRHLSADHVEIKAMHTTEPARRSGIGRTMVDNLVRVAAERGYRRISLETGRQEAFAAARRLYLSSGFEPCEPFPPYTLSPNSVCMTRMLS